MHIPRWIRYALVKNESIHMTKHQKNFPLFSKFNSPLYRAPTFCERKTFKGMILLQNTEVGLARLRVAFCEG